jgi:hypothetical protein
MLAYQLPLFAGQPQSPLSSFLHLLLVYHTDDPQAGVI